MLLCRPLLMWIPARGNLACRVQNVGGRSFTRRLGWLLRLTMNFNAHHRLVKSLDRNSNAIGALFNRVVVEDGLFLSLKKGTSLASRASGGVVLPYVQTVSLLFRVSLPTYLNSPCRDIGRNEGKQVGHTSHIHVSTNSFFHVTLKGVDGPRPEAH